MADPKYTYGTGKRKTALARVKLLSGNGSIVVNGRAFQEYFPSLALQNVVLEPFKVTGTLNKLDAALKVMQTEPRCLPAVGRPRRVTSGTGAQAMSANRLDRACLSAWLAERGMTVERATCQR